MPIIVAVGAVAVGVAGGLVSGGRLTNVTSLHMRGWAWLAGGIVCLALAGPAPAAGRYLTVLGCCGCATAWSLANRHRPALRLGLVLLALGIALNAVVIAANHGMPVAAAALRAIGAPARVDVTRGHFFRHVPLGSHTSLGFLADHLVLSPLNAVLSAGDLVMLIGIVFFSWGATRVIDTDGDGGRPGSAEAAFS